MLLLWKHRIQNLIILFTSENYDFPESGSIFAQSFLCLSLSVNALEDVGQYMRFAQVAPFLSNLPPFHKVMLVDVDKGIYYNSEK